MHTRLSIDGKFVEHVWNDKIVRIVKQNTYVCHVIVPYRRVQMKSVIS